LINRQYIKITKDYALEAAKAFATLPPDEEPFRFIYVSGEGATQTPGMLSPIFAKIKGETESELSNMRAKLPRLRAESVRPGGVDPSQHEAIKKYLAAQGLLYNVLEATVLPALRLLKPSSTSPTEPLGKFLTEMAMGRFDEKLEERNRPFGISALPGGLRIVSNIGFRNLAGLG
jgi:hypothetical protein